eukprot:1156720-Pelagomonas_calceolata.AAC.3
MSTGNNQLSQGRRITWKSRTIQCDIDHKRTGPSVLKVARTRLPFHVGACSAYRGDAVDHGKKGRACMTLRAWPASSEKHLCCLLHGLKGLAGQCGTAAFSLIQCASCSLIGLKDRQALKRTCRMETGRHSKGPAGWSKGPAGQCVWHSPLLFHPMCPLFLNWFEGQAGTQKDLQDGVRDLQDSVCGTATFSFIQCVFCSLLA